MYVSAQLVSVRIRRGGFCCVWAPEWVAVGADGYGFGAGGGGLRAGGAVRPNLEAGRAGCPAGSDGYAHGAVAWGYAVAVGVGYFGGYPHCHALPARLCPPYRLAHLHPGATEAYPASPAAGSWAWALPLPTIDDALKRAAP